MQKGIAVRARRPPPPATAKLREAVERPAVPVVPGAPRAAGVYGARDFARCVVISLIVGTALVLINVRPTPGEGPDMVRILINYLVPFLVASTSAIFANAARIKASSG